MNDKVMFDYGELEKKVLACATEQEEDTFKNFDPYTVVAQRHSLQRDVVKTAAFKGFYTERKVGRREMKAKQDLVVAQIEDALESEGLI